MAGFLPNEGENLIAQMLIEGNFADRLASGDLEMGLFTTAAPTETITEASIAEPTGTGYARITLTDESWSGSGDARSYAQQTFTAGVGGWTGSIRGYFICTKGGSVKRLIVVELDGGGPYTLNENDTYKITPTITVS